MGRRTEWPSRYGFLFARDEVSERIDREEAHDSLEKNAFFASWDPKVLDSYLSFALTDAEDGGVRLKMSGYQVGVFEWAPHVN